MYSVFATTRSPVSIAIYLCQRNRIITTGICHSHTFITAKINVFCWKQRTGVVTFIKEISWVTKWLSIVMTTTVRCSVGTCPSLRAGPRSGPTMQLPGAPTYKERYDVTCIIRNIVQVHSGFHMWTIFFSKIIGWLDTHPRKALPTLS